MQNIVTESQSVCKKVSKIYSIRCDLHDLHYKENETLFSSSSFIIVCGVIYEASTCNGVWCKIFLLRFIAEWKLLKY